MATNKTTATSLWPGLLVVVLVLLALAAALWPPRDDSLKRVREAGVLRVGYSVEAPYAMVDSAGMVTGEAAVVARELARRMGVPEVEWRQTEFSELVTELLDGRVDVVAAGMFITPDRAVAVAFSLPDVEVRPGLLVPKGNPLRLGAWAGLVDSDVRVAVLAGSVEAAELLAAGVPERRLVVVPDAATGRAVVDAGLAEALALSLPTVRWLAMEHPGLAAVERDVAPGQQPARTGFAFHPSAKRLRTAWDKQWLTFRGSPEHLLLVAPFGFGASDLAPLDPADGKASR